MDQREQQRAERRELDARIPDLHLRGAQRAKIGFIAPIDRARGNNWRRNPDGLIGAPGQQVEQRVPSGGGGNGSGRINFHRMDLSFHRRCAALRWLVGE